ncbi:MAG TPA: septum formation family protein [Dermatophilaceae bacterium]|nr:septum formation family protein [Dermatophilaceae bacterium]
MRDSEHMPLEPNDVPTTEPLDPWAPPTPRGLHDGEGMPVGRAPASTDKVSILAFVLSLVGMGIVAVPLGVWGIVRTGRSKRRGRGFAIAALAFSAAWAVAVSALVLVSGPLIGGGEAGGGEAAGSGFGGAPAVGDPPSTMSSATTAASTATSSPRAAGPLSKPRRVYWENLKPTMCVRFPPATDATYVTVVDCRAEHQEEVTSRTSLAGGTRWPGDDAVDAASEVKCRAAFERYVGIAYDRSRLELDSVTTDATGWADGDHTLVCLVLDPANEHLTRMLRTAKE